ncbi:hypothetical protein [Sphingobacterium cellulitidis]|nr:hypothetical protein [Sphingobacterium cellulitidis]
MKTLCALNNDTWNLGTSEILILVIMLVILIFLFWIISKIMKTK